MTRPRFEFGAASSEVLATVDPELAAVARLAIYQSPWDFMAREGRRDRATQERYRAAGLSNLPWPASAHNAEPPELARAVHLIPHPMAPDQWGDLVRFYRVASVVLQAAGQLGVPLVWGGGWRSPHDPGHFELAGATRAPGIMV